MTARRVHVVRGHRVEREGRTFASKAEARFHADLELLQREGRVLWWLRQVPIELGVDASGKVINYRVDYLVCYADGQLRFIDVKGRRAPRTREHDLKVRLVADRYPFDVEVEER